MKKVILKLLTSFFAIFIIVISFMDIEFDIPKDSVRNIIFKKLVRSTTSKLEWDKNKFSISRKGKNQYKTEGITKLNIKGNRIKLIPTEMNTTIENQSKLSSLINVFKESISNNSLKKSEQKIIKNLFETHGYKDFYIVTPKEIKKKKILFNIHLGALGITIGLLTLFFIFSKDISLFFIYVYQKYISPRKGFRCANAAIKGVDSCSETVRKVTKNEGFIAGLKEYRRTTKECKKTYEEYKNDKRNRDCLISTLALDTCAMSNCGEIGACAPEISASACDVSACDISACDIGAC